MSFAKVSSLSISIAVVLMALVGVGSASGTVICRTNVVAGCTSAWDVIPGVALKASLTAGTASVFVTEGKTTNSCTASTLQFNNNNTGSATETIRASFEKAQLTWAGCNNAITTRQGGQLELHNIAGTPNGKVVGSGLEVEFPDGPAICIYKAADTKGNPISLGVFKAGNPAVIEINTVLTKVGGLGCAATVNWIASYTMTSPKETLAVPAS